LYTPGVDASHNRLIGVWLNSKTIPFQGVILNGLQAVKYLA